jgi:hypothetical protein
MQRKRRASSNCFRRRFVCNYFSGETRRNSLLVTIGSRAAASCGSPSMDDDFGRMVPTAHPGEPRAFLHWGKNHITLGMPASA